MRATCASLFRANPRHTVFFVAFGPGPGPIYPQLLFNGRLVGSRRFAEHKLYCPLSDVEPWTVTVPTELTRLHVSSLLVKIFSSLRLSQTSVNTFQTLTTQTLSLRCIHAPCSHSTDVTSPSCRTHQLVSQTFACACSPHSSRNLHSHTHNLHVPFAVLGFNAAQVKPHHKQAASRAHLVQTWTADWRPRETELTS
jgi:hypothetical protein